MVNKLSLMGRYRKVVFGQETKCFKQGNKVFHTEKRIVSSLETILETNRYW